MSTMAPSHITIDEHGVARINGTRMKVRHIVEAFKSGAESPEKLKESYPHLSMGQIHAALSYYYDHQQQIDEEIQRGAAEAERLRAAMPPGPSRAELEQRLRERHP
jgi:uncharacterized protein (DUF433 family)